MIYFCHQVTLDSGDVLDPDEYLGPPVPGRSVAILGDTCDSSELAKYARNLDVLGIMRINLYVEGLSNIDMLSARGHNGE